MNISGSSSDVWFLVAAMFGFQLFYQTHPFSLFNFYYYELSLQNDLVNLSIFRHHFILWSLDKIVN